MTKYRKRRLAEASRVCFQSAVDLSRNVHENERDDDKETWDLLFMVGKVRFFMLPFWATVVSDANVRSLYPSIDLSTPIPRSINFAA